MDYVPAPQATKCSSTNNAWREEKQAGGCILNSKPPVTTKLRAENGANFKRIKPGRPSN